MSSRGLSLRELLERPVVLHGITLGHPIGILLEAGSLRVLGLDVACRDEVNRFLPLPAARICDGEIAVGSALLLFEDAAFYRRNAVQFSALWGSHVERDGESVGELSDLVVDRDGVVVEARVGLNGSTKAVSVGPDVRIRRPRRAERAAS